MKTRCEDLIRYLETQHKRSWPLLQTIEAGDLERPVYEQEFQVWTVHDVLAHIADAEAGLLGQVKRLLAGETTVPQGFDLARWNQSAARKGRSKSISDLKTQIEASHQEGMALIAGLQDADLDRVGLHSSGWILSVEAFLRRRADHRLEHASDLAIHSRDGALKSETAIDGVWQRGLWSARDASSEHWFVARYDDHILARFGMAEVVRLSVGHPRRLRLREKADEIWALIEGAAKFTWRDERPDSPTSGVQHSMECHQATLLSAPFGVAFGVVALEDQTILLRLATYQDEEPGHQDRWYDDEAGA